MRHFFVLRLASFQYFLVFYCSDRGIVYSARAFRIPECTRNAAGTPLVQVLKRIFSLLVLCKNICKCPLLIFWIFELAVIFIGGRENNLHHSCEWICGGTISYNAHCEWLYQKGLFKFIFSYQGHWNYCNSTGLS